MTMGVKLLGCGVFLEGQEEGCDCLKDYEYDERVLSFLKEMYNKLDDDKQKTEEELTKIQTKYKGKEDKLLNNIIKKYPKQMIKFEDMHSQNRPKQPKKSKKYKPEL